MTNLTKNELNNFLGPKNDSKIVYIDVFIQYIFIYMSWKLH